MCALGVIVLFLGAIIEVVDITMAAMASFIIIICVIELGGYWPFLVFSATAVLSFLLLPNKAVVLIYVLYFGFYPIIKKHLERLPRIFSLLAKIAVFNIAILLYYLLLRDVLFADFGSTKWIIVVLFNVIFASLDLVQTMFVTAYVKKFRRTLQIHRFFK